MVKVLNPEKTVAYCAIVLSEMALIHRRNNSIITSNYIHFNFDGVSMPPVEVDGHLSDAQLLQIRRMLDHNLNSSMFRFAKILTHYRRKISKCLNSRILAEKERSWLKDPLNIDVDFEFSPRAITEERLFKWARKASDKAVPGTVGKSYTEYLQSVYERLQCEAVYEFS
jgi:hypothetical protein